MSEMFAVVVVVSIISYLFTGLSVYAAVKMVQAALTTDGRASMALKVGAFSLSVFAVVSLLGSIVASNALVLAVTGGPLVDGPVGFWVAATIVVLSGLPGAYWTYLYRKGSF